MVNIRHEISELQKFLRLLGMLFRRPPISREAWQDLVRDPADMSGETAERFLAIEPVFCPKCHCLVANVQRSKGGVRLVRDGKITMTIGNVLTTDKDGKAEPLTLNCPNRHPVRLALVG